MDNQIIITLFSITFTLVGGGIGYLLKQYLEKKKDLTSEITKERREIYQQYINLIIELFSNSKKDVKIENSEILDELFNFYKKYILYASPKVIKAFSDYFQFAYKGDNSNTKLSLELITKIMLEMRKDLGLKNKGLGENGEMLMRAIIKDYDSIWK